MRAQRRIFASLLICVGLTVAACGGESAAPPSDAGSAGPQGLAASAESQTSPGSPSTGASSEPAETVTAPLPTTRQEMVDLLVPEREVSDLFPKGKFEDGLLEAVKGPMSLSMERALVQPSECAILENWGASARYWVEDPTGPMLWSAFQSHVGEGTDSGPGVYQTVVIYRDEAAASESFDELVSAAEICTNYKSTTETPEVARGFYGDTMTTTIDRDIPEIDREARTMFQTSVDGTAAEYLRQQGDRLIEVSWYWYDNRFTSRDRDQLLEFSDRLVARATAQA